MSPASESLHQALRELAQADAAEVVAEARGRARARAAKLIEDQLVEELLASAARIAERHPGSASADQRPSGQAWWTYCVLWAHDAERIPPRLEGVEPGTTVEIVAEGQLAALVSAVPAEDYDDASLREHLEDLAWVERTARSHEAVLEETMPHTAIVPLRLCTLYRETSGVQRLLREHAELLLESLVKIDGCTEWGVKVFAEETEAGDPATDREPERPGERPGATYLLQRRRERERAELGAERRARCAEAVHEQLSTYAQEAISNPPQRPELHGRKLAMVLNSAYLVAADRTDELQQAIAALKADWGPEGLVIELTGPWPAYNFVTGAAGVMR